VELQEEMKLGQWGAAKGKVKRHIAAKRQTIEGNLAMGKKDSISFANRNFP
jgi:hypothetical protein